MTCPPCTNDCNEGRNCPAKIKQAIKELESQEPVAWMVDDYLCMRADWIDRLNWKGVWVDVGRAIPDSWTAVLYTTHPPQRTEQEPQIAFKAEVVGYVEPQRTWVGLTDEQIKTIEAMALTKNMAIAMTMATLKENNT
jgi:hypothetical protein